MFYMQMNALHEPWDDDAMSEDMSWQPDQRLASAQARDELADTATSDALGRAQEALDAAVGQGDQAAVAAAAAALHQLQEYGLPMGLEEAGLEKGPARPIDLGSSLRGPTVSTGAPLGELRFAWHFVSAVGSITGAGHVSYTAPRVRQQLPPGPNTSLGQVQEALKWLCSVPCALPGSLSPGW